MKGLYQWTQSVPNQNKLALPHQHFPQQKQQDQYLKTFQEIVLQFL